MGSQSKRKKGTKDQRQTINDIKRQADQDATKNAMIPAFEGAFNTVTVISQISFVDVYDTLGAETTSLPQRISKLLTYIYNVLEQAPQASLLLQLDGNFTDSSVYANTVTANNANGFLGSGKFGTNSWRCNYPTDTSDLMYTPTSQSIPSNNLNQGPNGFSLSMWVFPQGFSVLDTGQPMNRGLITKADSFQATSPYKFWLLQIKSNGDVLFIYTDDGGLGIVGGKGNNPIINGQWNHIVAVRDNPNSAIKLYVNNNTGNMTGGQTLDAPLYGGIDYRMYIGYTLGYHAQSNYTGYMDAIQYFNFPLTATQVANLYQFNTLTNPRVSKALTFLYNIEPIGYSGQPYFTSSGSNYKEYPDSAALDLTTAITVAIWFNSANLPSQSAAMINKGGYDSDATGENLCYGIRFLTGGNLQAGFEETNGTGHEAITPAGVSYADGLWHLAVYTYGGTDVKIYVDDMVTQKATNNAPSVTPEVNSKPLVIGKNARANDRFMPPGSFLDQARIWNRVLTQTERQNLYNDDIAPSSGLVFEELFNATGTFAPDIWIKFDNSFAEANGNSSINLTGTVTYSSSIKKFGTHSVEINYPTQSTLYYFGISGNNSSNALDVTNGFSVSMWVYLPSDVTNVGGYLFGRGDGSGNVQAYAILNTSNQLYFRVQKNSSTLDESQVNSPTPVIFQDEWVHLVFTYNAVSESIRIYRNGNDIGTQVGSPSYPNVTTNSWGIGNLKDGAPGDGTWVWSGRIDEFMYFKGKVLNQAEIDALYTSNGF